MKGKWRKQFYAQSDEVIKCFWKPQFDYIKKMIEQHTTAKTEKRWRSRLARLLKYQKHYPVMPHDALLLTEIANKVNMGY